MQKKNNKNYVGIEINPNSMNNYLLPYVQTAVDIYGNKDIKVELRLGNSIILYNDLINKFDLCYTSPPYFDFEDYGFHNKTIMECFNYDEYHKKVTIPVFSNIYKYLIDGGVLALQTEKDKKLKQKWIDIILSIGFKLLKDTITGKEKNKYSILSKRDQSLLIFIK
jgi:DNA modification methylase